ALRTITSTTKRRFRYIPRLPPVARPAGRARHSVRAAGSNLFAERRARSDAPYLTRYRNFFVTVLAGDRIGTSRNGVRFARHLCFLCCLLFNPLNTYGQRTINVLAREIIAMRLSWGLALLASVASAAAQNPDTKSPAASPAGF